MLEDIDLEEALKKISLLEEELEKHKANDIKKSIRLTQILKVSDTQQMSLLNLKEKFEAAKIEAERANRSKSIFLSNMSHEIRTPMNSILGFAEILHQKVEDESLKPFCLNIKNSGIMLLQLINDILNISKIESGKMKLENTKVSLSDIIINITAIFQSQADAKGIELLVEVGENMPTDIMIDRLRLNEILINLISNAIKFTSQGFVKLTISQVGHDKDSHTIDMQITVEDSGVGILDKDKELIFNVFEQSTDQDENKYGGTGLGLSITKKIVKLMNGTIVVESEKGSGSSFVVLLKDIEMLDDVTKTKRVSTLKQSKAINLHILDTKNMDDTIIDIEIFLDDLEDEIDRLYKKSMSSNSFVKITLFCQELKKSALKHDATTLVRYSDLLLGKVDIADINSVVQLLPQYKQLLDELKQKTD